MSFRVLLATFAASSTLLIAQPKPETSTLSNSDRKFIDEAYQGGRTEVTLGHLAMERASDPQVKAFGEMMVKDHTQGNETIAALAKEKGLTLPAEKPSSAQTKLSKLSGHEFDKAYISDMVTDHRKDITEFERKAQSANSKEVRSLASNMLPTLQKHFDRATELHKELDKKGAADRTAPAPVK